MIKNKNRYSGGAKVVAKRAHIKTSKKTSSRKTSRRGAGVVVSKTQVVKTTDKNFFSSPYSIETRALDIVDKCEKHGTALSTWKQENITFMSRSPQVFWAKLVADMFKLVSGKLLRLRVNRVEKLELIEVGGSKKSIQGADLGKKEGELNLVSGTPKKYDTIKIYLSDKITHVHVHDNDSDNKPKEKVKSKK